MTFTHEQLRPPDLEKGNFSESRSCCVSYLSHACTVITDSETKGLSHGTTPARALGRIVRTT